MLKKMQWRFILAAMAAFGIVTFVLIVVINIASYYRTTSLQDALAESILEYEQKAYEYRKHQTNLIYAEPEFPPIAELPGSGPEALFTTRFFAVYYNQSGNTEVISKEYIYSIDEDTAKAYTEAVLHKGRDKGYYGDYRYHVKTDGAGSMVLFLNVSSPLQFMKSLLFISIIIGILGLLVVFLLVLFFSRYAVRPYVKNIERQKRFITDAGHELKTPITSISTSADIAAMEYEGDEWIANIQKQVRALPGLWANLWRCHVWMKRCRFQRKAYFP